MWVRGGGIVDKNKEKTKEKKNDKGKDNTFYRGGNSDKNKDNNDGWSRSGNAEKKK